MPARPLAEAWEARLPLPRERGMAPGLAALIAILLALTVLAGADPAARSVLPAPPWSAASEETPASASPAFQASEEVLRRLATRPGQRLADERYALSPQWGRIVRAGLVYPGADAITALHVICWIKPGARASLLIEPDHYF